ncbi:MAG: methyltransferase [Bacteroidota bacterium]
MPCLKVAAELNVAAIVENDPHSPIQLAAKTKSNPENLFRIIRALSTHGIFTFDEFGRIENTDLSRVLIDSNSSIRQMILHHLGRLNWTMFSELPYSVKTGRSAFVRFQGKDIYEYLSENPDEAALFDQSMTNLTRISLEPILSVYDFGKFKTIVDIGGGDGLLLSAILRKYPNLQGILFDRSGSMNNAPTITEQFGVTDRVKIVEGDFFETIPHGADVYIMKNVVHNWSDPDGINILKKVSEAIPQNSKLLVIEMVIDKNNRQPFGKLIDIEMMVFTKGGRERTRKQYRRILGLGGFNILRYVPTISPLYIIEAQKFPRP